MELLCTEILHSCVEKMVVVYCVNCRNGMLCRILMCSIHLTIEQFIYTDTILLKVDYECSIHVRDHDRVICTMCVCVCVCACVRACVRVCACE